MHTHYLGAPPRTCTPLLLRARQRQSGLGRALSVLLLLGPFLLACTVRAPTGTAQRELERETRDWLSIGRVAAQDLPAARQGDRDRNRPAIVSTSALDVPDTRANPVSPAERRLDMDVVGLPLDRLLYALARDAGLELHLRHRETSAVTLSLRQATLESILEAIASQVPFDYELAGTRLEVAGKAAYTQSYPIDYLNLDRVTRSRVGLATRVGTINAHDLGTSGIANSSETQVENLSEHHFWRSMQADLDALLREAGTDNSTEFTLNRDAALLTLSASLPVHTSVRQYLRRLHERVRRQVLIEATVVEVALSDDFQAGVDWQVLASGLSGISAAQIFDNTPALSTNTVDRIVPPAGIATLVQAGRQANVSVTLNLLEQFGDVRILSRPRIIALNNQSSVLKVVDNRVYFTLNVERRFDEDSEELITESSIHTVPVGLVMNVTPFIEDSRAVMLNVRPTLSRILGFVNDPNPSLALANVRNGVPEIQVREMESMLRVQSGDMAIIGGLMQETRRQDRRQLPGLARIPLLGKLFGSSQRAMTRTELLIVLRPTVMDSPGSGRDA